MEELKLRDEFIKLGQAMKAAGIVSSGIDDKNAYSGRTGNSEW
jgi:hypothetical protein